MTNNVLYIGLNGYAGAGKDTVAKMLKTILSQDWNSLEECKEYYYSIYTNPTISATYNDLDPQNTSVLCIAYADQLKDICAQMFGIPRQRWYQNKSTAWICINDNFQYTEIKPDDHIITAEEYYYSLDKNDDTKYWMSLREILVYVGTYVLQSDVNQKTFVNIVRNKIKEERFKNHNLKYVIVTDNRFTHEIDFIRENNGITMSITRDSIQQLDNIAEHELDDYEEYYDYIIDNSAGYDELFSILWNMVHENIEFNNETVDLYTRDNVNNYLRIIKDNNEETVYKLCAPFKTQQLYMSNGVISVINPIGGPMICINEKIEGSESYENPDGIIPYKIEMNEINNQFLIYEKKQP